MSASAASSRISAECTRCQTHLIQPQWSEWMSPDKTIHIWSCPVCGNEFETVDNCGAPAIPDEQLVDEFLPNLLVA